MAMTALAAIEHAAQFMHEHSVVCGHGYANVDDEAAVLVAFVLAVPAAQIDDHLNRELNPTQLSLLQSSLKRRCADRTPLAYITGDIFFAGSRFLCDERALVPRSLIAQWLEQGQQPWINDAAQVTAVLDLCTGGASLAILAARHFCNARVVGSDISSGALALAEQNRQLHQLDQGRLELVHSDLFSGPFFAQSPKPQFDLILCNPPYVNAESMQQLPDEFRKEPALALAAGADGMDVIRQILGRAGTYLTEAGLLVLEIGHEADHFEAAFPRLEFTYLPIETDQHVIDDMVVLIEKQALQRAFGA
jgi:ribosomal protein L3 glutamine methyltransferase